jgi:hypothetical protein
VRKAILCVAAGEDAEAEPLLRCCIDHEFDILYEFHTRKIFEGILRPYTVLAELLERRGTEEALAEARTLRDEVAQQLARDEARSAAALEETRAAAAAAVRQWRGERSKATEREKGGKKKGKRKKKKRRGKARGEGASSAAVIEEEPPREPAGEQAEEAAAVEGVADAEAEQKAEVEESEPPEEEEKEAEEEKAREECAICLQDLELEDEGGESEALVVLRCGHRFHEICGDMWCAKCADKGWGVTCPGCRAPYVL